MSHIDGSQDHGFVAGELDYWTKSTSPNTETMTGQ